MVEDRTKYYLDCKNDQAAWFSYIIYKYRATQLSHIIYIIKISDMYIY